jgi:glycosyltransferase involved in cell wall biosynthesis
MALRLESPAMHQLVQEWLHDGDYDIVQIEGIELAQYTRHVDSSRSAVIFDDHNCEYLLQQRNALTDLRNPLRWHAAAYSLVQWAKLRRYEAQVCASAQAVIAVSKLDQMALQQIEPRASIYVAPNGIDLEPYARATRSSQDVVASDETRFTLLFTGKMDYRPNIDAVLWFASQVLPFLVAAVPDIRFQIVGMNPHPRLDTLRQNPHIEITGEVTDPLPYLLAANVFVIPMRVGGGTRFKALEAMAARKAIVTTSLGVEGIGITNEQEMLIANAPDEFAIAILRLLADQRVDGAFSRRLGDTAYSFVAANYTWDRIIPIIDRVYSQLRPNLTPIHSRPIAPGVGGAHHDPSGAQP